MNKNQEHQILFLDFVIRLNFFSEKLPKNVVNVKVRPDNLAMEMAQT